MSRLNPNAQYPASEAGRGFRFVRLGELIKPTDEYYSRDGVWVRTSMAWQPCKHARKYRRRMNPDGTDFSP